MLIYVEGKNFLGQTFVLSCDSHSTVSRVKALLLHLLHDVGLGEHYFRLKFNDQYLREPLTLQHYSIAEMSVLQMVPISFGRCTRAKTAGPIPRPFTPLSHHASQPHPTHTPTPIDQQQRVGQSASSVGGHTMDALRKEVKGFKRRESLLRALRVIVLVQLVLALLDLATSYWWSGFITGLVAVLSILFLPTFVHIGGSVGVMRKWDKWLMVIGAIVHLIFTLFLVGLFLYLLSADLLLNGCYPGSTSSLFHEPSTALGCSYHVWLGLLLYPVQVALSVTTCLTAVVLRINFNFKAGLLVEPTLTKTKQVSELLEIAQEGRSRDKRQVAFELSNIALLGDSNKREITAEGGYQVLISLASEEDGVTQEYAVEALAELLSLHSIQNDFIAQGGVATVCALLCSPNSFVMEQAAAALSHLTPQCSSNRVAIVEENGISSLMKAFHAGHPGTQALVLKCLLDLALCPNTLPELCASNEVLDGIVRVISGDREGSQTGSYMFEGDTTLMALQVLDEMSKLQPSNILGKVELVQYLLESLAYASTTHETQLLLPAVRVLLIFAADKNKSKHLLEGGKLLATLEGILNTCGSNSQCPGLQSEVVRIVELLMQRRELRSKLVCEGVRRFLEGVKEDGCIENRTVQAVTNCLLMLESQSSRSKED